MSTPSIDPRNTYLHLENGYAEALPADERFWPSVMSGELRLDGWLVGSFESNPGVVGQHSEIHPNGDEVHLCQVGAMSAILEHDDGDEVIDFDPGEVCLIPAGVWHRLEAREPNSRVFTLTFGQGTEHRSSKP
jgi:mannose-6-phosphate isomerase-like protein (cupin superfamily)